MINPDNAVRQMYGEIDFKKIQKVMGALDWTWWDSKSVPTIERLKGCASELLREVIARWNKDGEYHDCATGGFKASISPEGFWHVAFNIEESYNDDIDKYSEFYSEEKYP